MVSMSIVKRMSNIQDELPARARRRARRTGRPLCAVVEEGLHQALTTAAVGQSYALPDRSVGEFSEQDPLDAYSWHDLREVVYGDPERR